jgi:hypothetical protein
MSWCENRKNLRHEKEILPRRGEDENRTMPNGKKSKSHHPKNPESRQNGSGGTPQKEPSGFDVTPLIDKINSLIDAYKSSHADKPQDDNKNLFWNRITACGTVVAAFGALVYAGIAYSQWQKMAEANKISTAAFVNVNRPFVGADGIDEKYWRTDPNRTDGKLVTTNDRFTAVQMDIDAYVKNFGPVAGTNFTARWEIFVDKKKIEASGFPDAPDSIFPGQSRHLHGTIGSPIYTDVINGNKVVEVEISFAYTGPSSDYRECRRFRFEPNANAFISLGPIC